MGRRNNEKFLNTYIELEKLCCEKFGVSAGGVTEYINRLNNARFAPGRDEVLPKLVRYRNIRNRFAHEPQAIRSTDEIDKNDIKWVAHFKHETTRKKDPISKYLRKARRFARRKRIMRFVVTFCAIATVVAVAILLLLLLK